MEPAMNRLLLALAAATALTFAAPAAGVAQDMNGQAAAAKPAKTLQALTAADIDPIRLLPPPPVDGSDRQKAELAELRHYQDTRTGGQLDQALWDDEHENASLFISVLGPKFDLATLPQTARLIAVVENDQEIAAGAAKKAFHRHRPWIFDDTLVGCPRGKAKDPLSSYPSGHGTVGYTDAVVLAALMPDHAADIMTRASEFAESRLICGVHFRSDIIASEALGTAVGVALLKSPALQDQVAAAKAELKAAGLTAP
jgi:acid phosphatase (class A)